MWRAFVLGVMGCGRIGFSPVGHDDATIADVPPDAYVYVCPCSTSMTASDPVVLSGTAVRGSTLIAQTNVTASARLTPTGSALANDVTGILGNFSLSVPTGGAPLRAYLVLEKTGFLTSIAFPDRPFDANVSSIDGFMAMQADVDTLYNLPTPNVVQDPSMGVMLLTVLGCNRNGIAGATVVLPPPAHIIYSDNGGLPSNTPTSTGPSGRVWALNVPAGQLMLEVTAPGHSFVPMPVDVMPSSTYFMGVSMWAAP